MNNIIYGIALAATLITPIGTYAETVNDDLFVQIPISDYVILTNQIHAMWTQVHSTEQGRVGIHGSRVGRIVDVENKTVTFEYSDGYKYTDKMSNSDIRKFVPKSGTNETVKTNRHKRARPQGMSDAQWEFVQKADMISAKRKELIRKTSNVSGEK